MTCPCHCTVNYHCCRVFNNLYLCNRLCSPAFILSDRLVGIPVLWLSIPLYLHQLKPLHMPDHLKGPCFYKASVINFRLSKIRIYPNQTSCNFLYYKLDSFLNKVYGLLYFFTLLFEYYISFYIGKNFFKHQNYKAGAH